MTYPMIQIMIMHDNIVKVFIILSNYIYFIPNKILKGIKDMIKRY